MELPGSSAGLERFLELRRIIGSERIMRDRAGSLPFRMMDRGRGRRRPGRVARVGVARGGTLLVPTGSFRRIDSGSASAAIVSSLPSGRRPEAPAGSVNDSNVRETKPIEKRPKLGNHKGL